MKRVYLLLFFSVLLIPNLLWAAPSPTAQVRQIVDSVLDVLSRNDVDYATKRKEVSGLVQTHINIQSMSQRTLGIHWNKADASQQEKFSKLFVQILEMTYLNRIEDYSGGKVDYLKERTKGDKAIVDTQFVSDKLEIPVQYKMVLEQDAWQIYDVVIENVSLVRNYRSSYGEIVSKEGFEGLFTRIENKLAENVAANEKK